MSKASGTSAMGIDLPGEAEPHLRAVLESQPVVLARLTRDGTFLAINEAGLSMLGAQSLEQVLGTSLTRLVPAEEQQACQAFLERAMGGQRGSFEADLIGLTGSRHTFELHARAHPGAPDGIASVLISFRDVTESRRLEQSLVDAAARQAEQEALHEAERARLLAELERARQSQSDQFALDEQFTELERRLADAIEQRAQLVQEHAGELAALREALSAQQRLADTQSAAFALLDGSDQQLAELRRRYEALDSERQQLLDTAGLLRSEAEARQQTVDELTERLRGLDAERQHAVETADTLRLDLDQRHSLVAELTGRLELLESDQQQASETIAQLQRDLESRTALATELAARIEALESEQVALRAAADAELFALRSSAEAEVAAIRARADAEKSALAAAAESERAELRAAADAELAGLQALADAERADVQAAAQAELAAVRAAFEQEQTAVRGQMESALQQLQTRYDTDTGVLRSALNESLTEQARLAEAMAAAEAEASKRDAELQALRQSAANERQAHAGRLVELEANAATRLAEIEGRVADAEREHQVRLAELERASALRIAELEAAAAAYQAERDTAEAAASAHTAERDAVHAAQVAELEAAHAARLTDLEAALAQALERADDALAAVQRAEEAFGAERQRLEDALLSAVDAERAAKQALSAEIASRTFAERGQRQMQQAIERFAREAGLPVTGLGGAAPAPVKAATTSKALADRLGEQLPRRLGDGLTLELLSSGADVSIAMEESAVTGAIGAFADSRRVSMLGGQVTTEIAEVTIDQAVGKVRGMAPGRYVLVAMNIDGPGAQQGFPQEIFDSADPRPWREVKEDLHAARTAILGAGGQIWLTREGASVMIVEFYLPRGGTR